MNFLRKRAGIITHFAFIGQTANLKRTLARFFTHSLCSNAAKGVFSEDMHRISSKTNILIGLWLLGPFFSFGQVKDSTTVKAGQQYDRSKIHQWLWGKHYRKEWATPVTVPYFLLDTAAGGLTPYEAGGGRQSKSLRLQNWNKKEFVLRSIDKSFGKALPEIYQGTFIEHILNDQVSIAHPYSAITISPMAKAGGIFYTIPQIAYVPRQQKLESFNKEFGNTLYLFEQRPDENWEEAPNFGNAKKIVGTDKVLEKIFEDNDNLIDQRRFVRTRLFDMLIGDWGRHEDQWRWGLEEKDDKKIYSPIPRDRDQAYTKFDGALLGVLLGVAGLSHLQTFNYKIKDARDFNFPARNLDRKFANEVSKEDWVCIARDLQDRITDRVIEDAIKKLPPEVFPISGNEIIAKLKSRRDHLVKYANTYYKSLARKVDVVGSDKQEYFDVKRLNDEETIISVFKINKEGEIKPDTLYSRIFKNEETKEVRLYGLRGRDVFHLEGDAARGIKLRVIGGPDVDSIIDNSSVKAGKHKVEVYDDEENVIQRSNKTKLHISNDSSIHEYHYDAYNPDKQGFKPSMLYSNEDRFYVSLGYMVRKHQWRKYPFASEHGVYVHYSLTEKAFSVSYKGIINQFLGKWNLALDANWDAMRWTNYFGLGNETKLETSNHDYYRMRTTEHSAGAGLFRNLGRYQFLGFTGFYQNVKVLDDPDRFIGKTFSSKEGLYEQRGFLGLQANYEYSVTNDQVVPFKGSDFSSSITYVQNLSEPDSSFVTMSASFNAYFPLSRKFIFVVRGRAATLAGNPKFYQYNSIGGSQRLRGFRRNRFYGKSSINNNNELQWVTDFKSNIFNGKAGLVAFYDIGRVWMPEEQSSLWHMGYGGGVLVAPFNKLSFTITYGFSSEISLFHIRFNKILF